MAQRRLPHSEAVYAALKRDILRGALAPGAPLREEELGRSHRVSRTPVREALSRLETEGLAARHPRAGLMVSAPTLEEIIDLYVLREALEGLAARLAAERRTELDLARLEMLLQAAQRVLHAEDTVREIELGEDFHAQIWRIAGNGPLQRAINDVQEVLKRFQPNTLAYPGRAAQSLREHQDVFEAIRGRDSAAAERIAIEHVRQVRNTRITISIEGEQPAG
ncbi:MAG: GntR family transcriptional regulator [Chloroflexi bacterium]|nr:GntR family transcriptional regulator [Chloroflexota bacterium]